MNAFDANEGYISLARVNISLARVIGVCESLLREVVEGGHLDEDNDSLHGSGDLILKRRIVAMIGEKMTPEQTAAAMKEIEAEVAEELRSKKP